MAKARILDPDRPIKANLTVSLPVELVQWLRTMAAGQQSTQSEVVEWALLELKDREEPGR